MYFDHIPHYYGFNEFTPTMPELYWNVESQEQRIKDICKQLCKLVNYADLLGTNVNELQDVLSGDIDPIIIDAIEEWFSENEPQLQNDVNKLLQIIPADNFTAVNTVDKKIDDTATNLNGQISALETIINGQISALETIINGILANNWVTTNRIANNAVTLEKTQNPLLIVFGDSWTTAANTWLTTYAQHMRYSSFKTYGVIGAAFLNRPENLVSAQITTAENDSTVNKNNVKEVIVIGGVNDYRSDDTNPLNVANAILVALQRIEDLYPNAHVRYLLDCQISGYPYSWYENFCTIYNKGYDCDNLINAMAFNTYAYNSDQLHPNGTGENLIAAYLQSKSLMSFITSVVTKNDFTVSSANSSITSANIRKCKDMVIMRFEIRHEANASGQITFNLPEPYNNILFDRTHTVISEFTSVNPGKYAVGYAGGLVAASNTLIGTDYVTVITKLPY